jgi:hypothetical protein
MQTINAIRAWVKSVEETGNDELRAEAIRWLESAAMADELPGARAMAEKAIRHLTK